MLLLPPGFPLLLGEEGKEEWEGGLAQLKRVPALETNVVYLSTHIKYGRGSHCLCSLGAPEILFLSIFQRVTENSSY